MEGESLHFREINKRGMMEQILQKQSYQDLPGGPVVKTLPSNAGRLWFNSCLGNSGLKYCRLWPKIKKKKKRQSYQLKRQNIDLTFWVNRI